MKPLLPHEYRRHVETVLDNARLRQHRERLAWQTVIACAVLTVLAVGFLAWCFYGNAPSVFFTLTP